jgi:hypothetical protein
MATIQQELAPIVIGIVGESELEGKHASIRRALKEIFDCLDERYPTSPKMLLTRLAPGVETLGAEDVLERKGWEIVAPLPLPIDVYVQNFDERAAQRLRSLTVEADNQKQIRMFTLDPLRSGAEHSPILPSVLGRPSEMLPSERADHYAQAGLFIAERCAILIALIGAHERPDRIGHLVRYRLRGDLDDAARIIMQRSRVLLSPAPLDIPPIGPVWVIDAPFVESGPKAKQAGFTPFSPGADNSSPTQQLRECFRLADRLDEFNIRAQRLDQDKRRNPSSVGPDMPAGSARLSELMHVLSTIQMDMNRRLKWTFWSLAGLFCVAFFMFEAQIDLNERWGVFGYIAALILGIAIYKFAWARRWQPFAQDYRAVAEAFRVQVAWWNCGLVGPRHRVDRFYLCGASGSLGLVRAAIRHMIDAAELRSCQERRPTNRSAPNAHPGSDGAHKGDEPPPPWDDGLRWTEEQIAYLDNRLGKRRTAVSFVDAVSWFLIVASLGPEVAVAINTFGGDVIAPLIEGRLGPLRSGILLAVVIPAIGLTFLLSAAPWVFSRSAWADRTMRTFETPNLTVSAAAGLLLALGVYLCAALAGTERVSAGLLIFSGVLVASVAYAMQFVSDQLAWAGEMRSYEDALGVFRKADSALKAIDRANIDAAEKKVQRDTIIEALGLEALKENEGWLRAHRERPLEPLPPT